MFFMVYLQGEKSPSYQHSTLESAENEAKRLAKTHGKKAYVLCSLKSFEFTGYKEEDCRPPIQDLSF